MTIGPTDAPEPARVPKELASAFAELADRVYAGDTTDDVLTNVCEAAPLVVPGCDHATVMVRRHKRLITAAASDEIGRRIDQAERELEDGPCVDAIIEHTPQLVADLADDGPWPTLREWILTNTPVRGAMAYRLMTAETKIGALNLFSDTPGVFTADSADVAAIFAAFASVAVTAADEHGQAKDLRAGLESNREIGKAIGLLMAFHGITDEEAFEVLRRHSQETNVRVAEIADQLVDHHNRR
ncbi:MAG TPA: GAF and ANTAR domain-containing protein [Streptosporangiales bacterium]